MKISLTCTASVLQFWKFKPNLTSPCKYLLYYYLTCILHVITFCTTNLAKKIMAAFASFCMIIFIEHIDIGPCSVYIRVGEMGMGWVVASAKTKKHAGHKWLTREAAMSTCTHNGPRFYYRCLLTVGAISGPHYQLKLWKRRPVDISQLRQWACIVTHKYSVANYKLGQKMNFN